MFRPASRITLIILIITKSTSIESIDYQKWPTHEICIGIKLITKSKQDLQVYMPPTLISFSFTFTSFASQKRQTGDRGEVNLREGEIIRSWTVRDSIGFRGRFGSIQVLIERTK